MEAQEPESGQNGRIVIDEKNVAEMLKSDNWNDRRNSLDFLDKRIKINDP